MYLYSLYDEFCFKLSSRESRQIILKYCGDFEVQCKVLRMLLSEDDVLDFGEYFAEVWFKDLPDSKAAFKRLLYKQEVSTKHASESRYVSVESMFLTIYFISLPPGDEYLFVYFEQRRGRKLPLCIQYQMLFSVMEFIQP